MLLNMERNEHLLKIHGESLKIKKKSSQQIKSVLWQGKLGFIVNLVLLFNKMHILLVINGYNMD